MMHTHMEKTELNKEELFRDYVSRYEYKDINKALDDFDEIFEILDAISYAIQINRFNGHPRGNLEDEVVSMFSILCNKGVIKSYPFESGDRYSSFSPQKKGD